MSNAIGMAKDKLYKAIIRIKDGNIKKAIAETQNALLLLRAELDLSATEKRKAWEKCEK